MNPNEYRETSRIRDYRRSVDKADSYSGPRYDRVKPKADGRVLTTYEICACGGTSAVDGLPFNRLIPPGFTSLCTCNPVAGKAPSKVAVLVATGMCWTLPVRVQPERAAEYRGSTVDAFVVAQAMRASGELRDPEVTPFDLAIKGAYCLLPAYRVGRDVVQQSEAVPETLTPIGVWLRPRADGTLVRYRLI